MGRGRASGSLATPPSQRVPEAQAHILEWVWRPSEDTGLHFTLLCRCCRTRYATIALSRADGPVTLPAIASTLGERLRDRQLQLAYTGCPARTDDSLFEPAGDAGATEGGDDGDRTADP